jgi:hypothetical protein
MLINYQSTKIKLCYFKPRFNRYKFNIFTLKEHIRRRRRLTALTLNLSSKLGEKLKGGEPFALGYGVERGRLC